MADVVSIDPRTGATVEVVTQETTTADVDRLCQAALAAFPVLEELGRGGMGVVFRAEQISLHREVAVKMILRGQLASPADHDRIGEFACSGS